MKKNKKMLATIASVCAMACSLPVSAESASALPIKALAEKAVDANPYMASGDTNIHHDGYNTDTTDSVLPVAIYPEINVSYEKVNANASPAIFFDTYGHAVVPLLGGLAIRDINADETTTEGYFSPIPALPPEAQRAPAGLRPSHRSSYPAQSDSPDPDCP